MDVFTHVVQSMIVNLLYFLFMYIAVLVSVIVNNFKQSQRSNVHSEKTLMTNTDLTIVLQT